MTDIQSPKAASELMDILEEEGMSEAEEAMGQTDCPEGCYVEPDGHCPHGYESAALTLGII